MVGSDTGLTDEVQVGSSLPDFEYNSEAISEDMKPQQQSIFGDAGATTAGASSLKDSFPADAPDQNSRDAVIETPAKDNKFKSIKDDDQNKSPTQSPIHQNNGENIGPSSAKIEAPQEEQQLLDFDPNEVTRLFSEDNEQQEETSMETSQAAKSSGMAKDAAISTYNTANTGQSRLPHGSSSPVKSVYSEQDGEKLASQSEEEERASAREPSAESNAVEEDTNAVKETNDAGEVGEKTSIRKRKEASTESDDDTTNEEPVTKKQKQAVPSTEETDESPKKTYARRGRPPKKGSISKSSSKVATPETTSTAQSPVKSGKRGRPPGSSSAKNKNTTPRTSEAATDSSDVPKTTRAKTGSGKDSKENGPSPQVDEKSTPSYNVDQGPPRVMFSNSSIRDRPKILEALNGMIKGTTESTSPSKFDMLVVGQNELKRTSKLLVAIAASKPVVTDAWVTASVKQGSLQPVEKFYPQKQLSWGYNPANFADRSNLFDGKTIHVTPALRKFWGPNGFRDIETLGRTMGAERVVTKKVKGNEDEETVFLGMEEDDEDCEALLEEDNTCYTKDLLPYAALRGRVDLNHDEFQIGRQQTKATKRAPSEELGATPSTGKKRGRPRKSA